MLISAALLFAASTDFIELDVNKWSPEFEAEMRQSMMDALKSFVSKYNTVFNRKIFSPDEFTKIKVLKRNEVAASWRSSGFVFIFSQDKWRVKRYYANPGTAPLSLGEPIGGADAAYARCQADFGEYIDAFGPTSWRYNLGQGTRSAVCGIYFTRESSASNQDHISIVYRREDGMLSLFSVEPYPTFSES